MARIENGLIDADLGGGVIKQRVARPGAGKSGGYRTLLFVRTNDRAVFAFGFAKNVRDKIDADDAARLKAAAKVTMALSDVEMDRLVAAGTLIEVMCDDEEGDVQSLSK